MGHPLSDSRVYWFAAVARSHLAVAAGAFASTRPPARPVPTPVQPRYTRSAGSQDRDCRGRTAAEASRRRHTTTRRGELVAVVVALAAVRPGLVGAAEVFHWCLDPVAVA